MRLVLPLLLGLVWASAATAIERGTVLEFARKGWVYELRQSMFPPRPGLPPVRIHGRNMARAAICMLGEPPHARTRAVIEGFASLVGDVYGTAPAIRRARDPRGCGAGPNVHLRLYSGRQPLIELGEDMRQLDEAYAIGFSNRQQFRVISPAQAQTFFGGRGYAAHMLVRQPRKARLTPLEERYFASILLEELYQTYTFGMDILHFDAATPFVSKLEEMPLDLRGRDWDSPTFMQAMLRINPPGLCRFDVFMLHAVATAPGERTNDVAFLSFIDGAYDDLSARTDATFARLARAGILDPNCRPWLL